MNFRKPNLDIGLDEEQLWQVVQYVDFSYGLDVMSSLDNMDARALRVAKNIVLERDGGFKLRDGTTYSGSTAGYSTGSALSRLYDFEKWGSTVFSMVAAGPRLRLTGTTNLTTALASASLSFQPMGNYLYFVNGSNYYRTNGKSTGTTTVAATTADRKSVV